MDFFLLFLWSNFFTSFFLQRYSALFSSLGRVLFVVCFICGQFSLVN